ncbi:hypothetical protein CkaCkLH20_11860 [Colletotrichum karsti]|uniref:EKC/KEOPS complex subunit BUD32 n=1 Tax=Colletotrichum karsti TaxID=1095194 RepID=A0A9P6HTH4_9PEZI|nr:uncharacterized protein CkaCkLH20_11860 [Colletotrichum karsti]KAF9870758.1 hypothetical protein CkaCkLH20_11860 [Colletotrichum karsti]
MDIASKLRALETKLQQVDRIVSALQLSTPHAGRRTRRNNPRQTTKPTSDLDMLKDLLTGLHAELQQIREEVSRTSEQPSQETLPAHAASPSSALSSPPPSVVPDEHSDPPVDHPAPSPRVVDLPTHQEPVPSPLPDAPDAPDAGGPRADLEPPTAADSDSAALSPLSNLGSDVEWALQHAGSLFEAQGDSPTDPAPPEPAPITTRPKFSLTIEEMGVNLVPNIAKMVTDEDFTGKVQITNLPEIDWANLKSSIGRPKDREHLGNVYTKGPDGSGYAFLKLSPSTKFVLPDFSQMPQKPSEGETTAFLDNIARDPPKGSIPYYAGPPLTSNIKSFLHPGDALASMEAIAGGNSPYTYIGARYSGTGWHDDDALLWSCNYVSFGWKLWLVIAEHHRARFEAFIRRHWKANRCAQFVRHLSLFIGPSRLREEGIDFAVHCAGPGDMVIIRPGQYHAVVNYSSCFATAINFSLPGDPAMPPDLAVCKQCGLYPLHLPDFRVVSPPPLDPVPGVETEHVSIAARTKLARRPTARPQDSQPAKKPKTSRPHPELDEIISHVLKIDKLCHVPRIDPRNPPSPEVLKLAMAIGSRPAIQQFCDLVRSRREPNNTRLCLSYSLSLPSKSGSKNFQSDLLRLISAAASDDFEFDRVKPLLKSALSKVDDFTIWDQAYSAVSETTPPPRTIASSLQQTPWQHNTSSFANSSEHRRYVDDILKEELGTMYVGLPGFRDAYFGVVVGLEAASKEFFNQCLNGSNPTFHDDDGWEGWPQDANENSVLEWLATFVKKLVVFADTQKSNTTHQRKLLAQPNTPMRGSTANRKLDVGFVDKGETAKDSQYHWKQILVPGELKSNPSANIASKAWLDLGRYAREVLAAQDTRRFVLGFTLCGSFMRVWSFDRLGAIASEQFDINKDGLQFVITVLGFLWMDEEALGFDPTVKLSDNKRFINIMRDGSTERIVIDELLGRARCVAGRAATCWKAHPEGHPETPLVIKDSWQYPERDEEGDLLREVTDKDVVNVARYYHHETVQVHETNDDIWNNVRHGLNVTAASNYRPGRQMQPSNMAKDTMRKGRSSTSRKRLSSQTDSILPPSKRSCSASPTKATSIPPNRVHRRIILQDYGKPIYEASSRSALLAALVGCIEGHESLYKAGILHRDISINNLMINEDCGNPSWPAFLIDLDLAIWEPRESASGAKGKTGTRAFMAIGALLGEQHSFMHDLESFFWVLFWICIHYDKNGKDIGPTEFDCWNYESDTKLILSKAILDSFTHHGPNGLHACIVSTPAWATIAQSHFRRDHEMMFPLESARCIIAQLITGVASLHSAGIVHGDLHTGNILLSLPRDRLMDQTIEEVYKRHGRPTKIPLHLYQEMTLRKPAIPANAPPYIVKSLDLGGACDTIKPADAKVFIGDFSESWKPSSQTKHTLSTQYPSRAPEFMCGEKLKIPMGLPSDIWSLGCLIYRLLGPRNILESRAPDDDAVFAGIVGMLGKPPQEWWNAWDNRGKYFDGYDAKEVAQDILDGNGKPDQKRASLQRRVQVWLPEDGRSNISSEEQRDLLALLNPIFQWRSEDRPTASQLLSSSWMTKWGLPAVKAMEQASVQTVNKDADKGDPKVSNDPDTESQKLVQTEVVDKMKDGEKSKTGNKLQEGNKPETGGKEEIGEKMKAGKADTVEAKTDETKIGKANTGGTKTQTTSTAKVVPVKQIVGKK